MTKCELIPKHRVANSVRNQAELQTPGATREVMAMTRIHALTKRVRALEGGPMLIRGSSSMRGTLISNRRLRDSIHTIRQRTAKSITTILREQEMLTLMTSSTISSAGRRNYSGKGWIVRKRHA